MADLGNEIRKNPSKLLQWLLWVGAQIYWLRPTKMALSPLRVSLCSSTATGIYMGYLTHTSEYRRHPNQTMYLRTFSYCRPQILFTSSINAQDKKRVVK